MNAKEKWKPKVGGKYYVVRRSHVGSGVFKLKWEGSAYDEAMYAKGEAFKTKREAEFMFKTFGNAW